MIDLVIDASVVLKWFRIEGEGRAQQARVVRTEFAAGRLALHAPPLLKLELINVAGRRWGWDEVRLSELAQSLVELGLDFGEPDVRRVAIWTARGLTAYDAAYVALAEQEAIVLVTDDDRILEIAAAIASPLVSVAEMLSRPPAANPGAP